MKKHMVRPISAKPRRYESFEDSDDDDEEEDDFEEDENDMEYARIRRRGRRNRYLDDDDDDYSDSEYDDRRGRQSYDREIDYEDEEEEYDDDEEDDELFDDENEFYDGIIPNPILDQIDPDGAIDRWPELAQDPRFWRDSFLLLLLLFVGLAIEIDNPMTFLSADDINYESFYR